VCCYSQFPPLFIYFAVVFLAASTLVVPICKQLNVSPVIGYLAAGLVLGPGGLKQIRDLKDLNVLGEFGISFLLFEQGLELSLDRLKALSKYAFGLGSAQVALSTLAFSIFPFVGGVTFLTTLFNSPLDLVNISRWDEAIVVGAALSLSSSAFVLKILQEKGALRQRRGQATLGVLLLQDIAVVPLLVLLPIIEDSSVDGGVGSTLTVLGLTALKAVGGLGAIIAVGRLLLRRVFEVVAGARSSETFVGLCLLVALGTGELTDAIGLSSTLGAFAAGTLLAETNYRTQIEADLKPVRGLLLGLFFITTGASVDPVLLVDQAPTVLALLIGLIGVKSVITTAASLQFGLTRGEAVRVGLSLAGGGEFAFVVLTLAQRLEVLPPVLNRLLVGVVVLSMALTPVLADVGDRIGRWLEDTEEKDGRVTVASGSVDVDSESEGDPEPILICGFGPVGQIVSSLLTAPFIESPSLDGGKLSYIAFDLDPRRVIDSRRLGYPVFYGDGSQPLVLATAGVVRPKAIVVTYSTQDAAANAVERLRIAFPSVPIMARASDYTQYWRLKNAGATAVVSDLSEVSIRLGSELLSELGLARNDELTSAKMQLRQTLAEVARSQAVRTEFARQVQMDSFLLETYKPSGLEPQDLVQKSSVQVTRNNANVPVTAEELGVTVCLLDPDDDGSDMIDKDTLEFSLSDASRIDEDDGEFPGELIGDEEALALAALASLPEDAKSVTSSSSSSAPSDGTADGGDSKSSNE
jgi:monovalent cation:proton antiporter-2 (CPA2) family protein